MGTRKMPCALTVAGSDSGGGAGIQADLKTFAALDVHGTTAITCLTAQNPRTVRGIHACPPEMVRLQLETVFEELQPAAAKTGMLYSGQIIKAVAGFFDRRPGLPLVVDPVMVSTSRVQLLNPAAVKLLMSELLPRATLITPNLHEAEILAGHRIKSVEDMRTAARELQALLGCAVLVKGGHLQGLRQAIDIFLGDGEELLLEAPFVRGVSTHGTGCTYSAAITAWLAKGASLPDAVSRAKEFITGAIANTRRTARHTLLNSFWAGQRGKRI